jgi:GxxExxY protein
MRLRREAARANLFRLGVQMIEPSAAQNQVARTIVDAAFTVHRALGPGLLETAYEECLVYELGTRGLRIERQVGLPIVYRGERIEAAYRIDLLVDGRIVVEIKAAENLLPIHQAQRLTYLKLSGHPLGFLINFNVMRIKDGVRRFVQTS